MKSTEELKLPTDRGYTDAHVWAQEQPDGTLLLGITDFAQDQLGDVVYVDLPEKGTHFDKGAEFGSVESVKSVSGLFMPVSGTVEEVNSTVVDDPRNVNSDCYGQGWMMRIKPDSTPDLKDAQAYRASLG